MDPRSLSNPSTLVHVRLNDPDGETAASAERASISPFMVPVGSMPVNVSLYM